METTVDITWHQPDEREQGREDACWYIYQSTSDLVCSLSNGVKGVHITADGEMRIHVIDENGDVIGIIRYCDDFREYGITNDEQLLDFVFLAESEYVTPQGQKVRFDIIHNPWFDVYDDEGIHLDMLSFGLNEILDDATELLKRPDWLTY
jgi:hypothetical protein